ncbi:MAG: hypothetical protein ACXWQO_07555 [Bdellovibrionota bacterium]
MLELKHSGPGQRPNKTKNRYARACNLCGETFIATAPHSCFCEGCKLNSDLYRFHDWLPDAPAELVDQEISKPLKKPQRIQAA